MKLTARIVLSSAALTIVAPASHGAKAQEPVGHWDFTTPAADSRDRIRDRSGHSNDLLFQDCRWVSSRSNTALLVPAGGRIWCEKPGEALSPRQALGVIAWVRPLGTGQYCAVLRHGRGWGEDGTVGYRLLVYRDGVRFLLKAGRVINISGGRIIRGQWNQVAATYDGKEAVAFVNGVAVARDLVEGPVDYAGVEDSFEVGSADGGNLDGEIASLKVFDRAFTAEEAAADWESGKGIRLAPDEIAAQLHARLEKCALTELPEAALVRDRRTLLLAHMETSCDADYSRWEGRAGGWRLKHGVPGRFGLAVELPSGDTGDSGAPILYRGAGNCDLRRGTCEFWIRAAEGADLAADDSDRYLLTILPEHHIGYGERPGVHLVLRTQAATRSLELAANTDRIDWYSHLNGAWIADSAKTTLHLPLDVLAGRDWHHVVCSWSMEGEGRIWLLVDGKGVTAKLAAPPEPGRQIPCYKIFLGGSYFPEVFCPSARAAFDELRIRDESVVSRLRGFVAPSLSRVEIDERLVMEGEDLCRHFLDFTEKLQMGGGWEGVYTWPNLLPDESPGSYAAAAEDEYTMRHIVPMYLRAFEVLGEERYLRVAESCGQMLVETQDENGAWCQGYIIMPDKAHPVSPGGGSIEEGTQTDPLRVLFWLWRLTSRATYRDTAVESAEFVLGGQKPDGAWPLSVDSRTMRPGGGYRGYSTLNDGTTLWGMKAMLMGWHLTRDEKYLDALRKAGRWLIRAQLPGKAPGWAEQYGDDGRPAWAREFEPPAACWSAIDDAADALLFLYDLTAGDEYLAPLRRCVEWGLGMPEEHAGYLYYDPETGEPITAKGYRITRFSDPGFANASPYRKSSDGFRRIRDRIEARSRGPLVPARDGPRARRELARREVTIDDAAASLGAARRTAEEPIAHLDAFRSERFPAGAVLDEHPRHGRHFWPGRGEADVQRILDAIQLTKAAAGEIPAAAVPRYADDYFGFIDPARDWYETPLMRDGE